MWEKHIGVLPVSWTEQGDGWQFHLANVLSYLGHLGGRGASMGGGDVILDPPPMLAAGCFEALCRLMSRLVLQTAVMVMPSSTVIG